MQLAPQSKLNEGPVVEDAVCPTVALPQSNVTVWPAVMVVEFAGPISEVPTTQAVTLLPRLVFAKRQSWTQIVTCAEAGDGNQGMASRQAAAQIVLLSNDLVDLCKPTLPHAANV